MDLLFWALQTPYFFNAFFSLIKSFEYAVNPVPILLPLCQWRLSIRFLLPKFRSAERLWELHPTLSTKAFHSFFPPLFLAACFSWSTECRDTEFSRRKLSSLDRFNCFFFYSIVLLLLFSLGVSPMWLAFIFSDENFISSSFSLQVQNVQRKTLYEKIPRFFPLALWKGDIPL